MGLTIMRGLNQQMGKFSSFLPTQGKPPAGILPTSGEEAWDVHRRRGMVSLGVRTYFAWGSQASLKPQKTQLSPTAVAPVALGESDSNIKNTRGSVRLSPPALPLRCQSHLRERAPTGRRKRPADRLPPRGHRDPLSALCGGSFVGGVAGIEQAPP